MNKSSLIVLTSIIFMGKTLAISDNDSVFLQVDNQNYLASPKTKQEILDAANRIPQYTVSDKLEEQEYFEPESDLTDSAATDRFYKFIDKTMVNNKFNNFSSKVGDKIHERF